MPPCKRTRTFLAQHKLCLRPCHLIPRAGGLGSISAIVRCIPIPYCILHLDLSCFAHEKALQSSLQINFLFQMLCMILDWATHCRLKILLDFPRNFKASNYFLCTFTRFSMRYCDCFEGKGLIRCARVIESIACAMF